MSKLNRILWSGLVLGIAACGDSVTVTQPPEPVPGIRSVTVAPDGAQLAVGATLQMTAAVTTDPGAAAPTIAWSSSDAAKASVGATSGLVTGVAAGAAGIRATATVGTSTGSGVATVTVVAAAVCSVTGVSVSPADAALVTGQTLAVAANVNGTNCTAAQLGVTFASSNTAVATVNATSGLVSAVGAGSATITATSVTDASKKAALSVSVVAPLPATVSIQSVTQFATNLPVDLANVAGQIEVTLNVDPGSAPMVTKTQVLINGIVMAEQCQAACPTSSAAATPALAVQSLTLSTNTRQVEKKGSLFVPVIFNGPAAITARIYVAGSTTPVVSNAIPVVMQNSDGVVYPTTLVPASTSPSAVNGGDTWYKGNVNISGANYIAFFPRTPSVEWNSSDCGNTDDMVTGSPTAGISLAGTFVCRNDGDPESADVEDAVFETGYDVTEGTDPAVPADVIYNAADGYDVAGSPYTLDINKVRYNLLSDNVCVDISAPRPAASRPALVSSSCHSLDPVHIDNRGPSVAVANGSDEDVPGQVAFSDAFDQPWINGSYLFSEYHSVSNPSGDLWASDGGSGVASIAAHQYVGIVCTSTVLAGGNDLPETLTSNSLTGVRICTYSVDALGNFNSSGPSNYFGVDKVSPVVRLAGITEQTADPDASPLIATLLAPKIPADTIFGNAGFASPWAPFNANWVWGLEGLDTRAGFNQNLVTGYPAVQSLARFWPGGAGASQTDLCGSFLDPMARLLSDTWVRTGSAGADNLVAFECATAGAGYYAYNGHAVDRAGNVSNNLYQRFAVDQYGRPNITGLGFATALYTPGAAAPFGFSANDDLEIIGATAAVTMAIQTGGSNILRYPLGSLSALGTKFDGVLTNVVNGASASIPYFLFRVDETCTAAGVPYASCPATLTPAPYVIATKASVAAEYGTGAVKLPTNVSANVADVADQLAAVAIGAPMLATQFSPSTGLTPPWPAADLISWSASNIGANTVAVHVASTSIVVPYFDNASLWKLIGGEWVYCKAFGAPVLTDNGAHRFWTYTTATPTLAAGGPCSAAGAWRVMGTKGGAGLFSPNF
jgi:hypothetical protein